MDKSLRSIYIPQLAKAPQKSETVQVQTYLPDLETLTPVQGTIHVVHQVTYLDVSAHAETIVTLTCDRCLQQYNHRLALEVSELIWLEEPEDELEVEGLEREVAYDDLVEAVPPDGYFDPAAWLYEQLCLVLPARQLCDQNCPGILVETDQVNPAPDHRWASLETLKHHLSN